VERTSEVIEYWTDGSCSKNPGGPGGWAWITKDGRQDSGLSISTTNNIMELTAAIEAVKHAFVHHVDDIRVWSDSKYVVDGITSWIHGWKRKGWKTSKGEPVKNKELWIELDELTTVVNIEFRWVRGHTGLSPFNDLADKLAKEQTSIAQMISVPF
jgi:ribonuclease HI